MTRNEKYLAACADYINVLAAKYLRHFHGALDLDDLIQVGRMTVLKKVVPYFDPARGMTLHSFAYRCIEQELRRLVRTTELRGLLRPTQRAAWAWAMSQRDDRAGKGEPGSLGIGRIEPFGNRPRMLRTDIDVDDDPETNHEALIDRLHEESVLQRFEALPPDLRRIFLALLQAGSATDGDGQGLISPAVEVLRQHGLMRQDGKPYTRHNVREGLDAIRAWAREHGITP